MRHGVVAVRADASIHDVARALIEHGVHAVLVVGGKDDEPMGWVRTIDVDEASSGGATAADCIGERVTGISPRATVKVARYALALPGITHLAVRDRGTAFPIGVITEYDVGDPTRPLRKE